MKVLRNRHNQLHRVAIVVHAYYMRDARIRRYADSLVDEGYEVDVFCLRDAGESSRQCHAGVNIIRIPYTRMRGGRLSYYVEYATSLILLGLYLNALHFRRRYSVIHVNTPPDALVVVAASLRAAGVKVILDYHDLMPELYMSKYALQHENREIRLLKIVERWSARFSDVILTACDAFKEKLVCRGVPESSIRVIRNLPDPKLFESRKDLFRKNAARFTLLYIGTISERYGVDLAIRALARLRRLIPQIQLRIVGKISGEGAYKQVLQALAVDCGVADITEFGPPVPLDDVAEQMATCDVGVYTPTRDVHMDNAFSLKTGEFAAMGIPMVTTRTPLMEKCLGTTGAAFVESGDVDGFVSRVLRLHTDREFCDQIVRAADDFTRRNNWDVEKQSYLGVIKELVDRRAVPAVARSVRGLVKRGARVVFTTASRVSRQGFMNSRDTHLEGVRILTYHDVGPNSDSDWSVSAKKFAVQMRFLSEHYPLASLDDVRAWLAGERKLPDGAIAVTFDDGLLGVFDHAFPTLARYRIPAAVFVVEGYLLNEITKDGKHVLNYEHLQAMARAGVVVGSHSRSHVSLAACASDQTALTAEIAGSKSGLESSLSMPIRYFAYPYGTRRDVDSRVVAAVKDAGYEMGLTSIHGKISAGMDPFQVRRVKVERMDSLSTFSELLRGGMDRWAWIDTHASWLQSRRQTM